jgi:long-chain acyl-CoA synthetase
MYGITETANWLAGACAADLEPADGLLGAMWGGRAGVVDANGCVTGSGEGELAVQTPALMQGYFKRPDLTAEVLRDGWFLTGDTGAIGEDGLIRMTGRRKHEINRAGMKVHPEEIDLLMERHPDVMEACAFGLPDDISGEVVAVAIKLLDGAEGGDDVGKIAALKTWCRERLRRESVPEKWYIVPEIPKTDRGKINRQRVMAYCLERSG